MESLIKLRLQSNPNKFTIIAVIIMIVSISTAESMAIKRLTPRRTKRGFAGSGCLGIYDRPKYASLALVCDECYQLYRDINLHKSCRQDCFRNEIFVGCVDALLLKHEHKKLEEMVKHLNGRK